MADVGEETTLDLVEFLEFAVAFFEHLFVAVQLVAQGELAKTKPAVHKAAGDRNNAGQHQEVQVVEEQTCAEVRPLESLESAGNAVQEQDERDGRQALPERPVQ